MPVTIKCPKCGKSFPAGKGNSGTCHTPGCNKKWRVDSNGQVTWK